MLAGLDRPQWPMGAVKTADANWGGIAVASALETEPWNRRVNEVEGQALGLSDSCCRRDIGHQRHYAQNVRHFFQFMAGASMGAFQHRFSPLLAVDIAG